MLKANPIGLRRSPGHVLGFTLMEMLVVIGIIAVLVGLFLPAIARAKARGRTVHCQNNIRQLGFAVQEYAGENDDMVPPRLSYPDDWRARLKPFYGSEAILVCPSDKGPKFTSYIINGFDDYFEATLTPAQYLQFRAWSWPLGFPLNAAGAPTDTIVFGEKKSGSPHIHMDLFQGLGNDVEEIDEGRHVGQGNRTSIGSNFAFLDSSVRLLSVGTSLSPKNLWAITEAYRNMPLVPQ